MLLSEIFPLHDLQNKNLQIENRVKSLRAKANLKRTFITRIVDKINDLTGTSIFLFLNIVFFVVWVLVNNDFFPSISSFDPYPFNFLTMTVSLEAIILSILVLISQSRDAKLNDLREEVTIELLVTTEAEVTKALNILSLIAKRQGITLENDMELKEMEQKIDTNQVVKRVELEIGDTLI